MNTEEVLSIANKAVSELTNKYLNDLQSELLKASYKNQTYEEFAETHGYCIDYIKKDIGSKLWHLLSEALGEKVTKKNFKQALERSKYNGEIDISNKSRVTRKSYRDLGVAPDVSVFDGRKKELNTFKQWIIQDKCRVVAVLGMGGIGKTFVAAKLVEQIEDKFDFVIWCSLRNSPSLTSILSEIINFLSNKEDKIPDIKTLLKYFRSSRCLIVLDNLETILQPGDFAGNYRSGYEEYGELLRLVEETSHQSCLLLTSREKPFEIAACEAKKSLVHSFKLDGSLEAAQAIVKWQALVGSEEQKQQLFWRFGYNPQILKIIATLIKDVFDGEIEEFLKQDTIGFNSVRVLFDQQFERLSEIEQIIIFSLGMSGGWTSISELLEDINASVSQIRILEALQSLCWRSLIEKRGNQYILKSVMMDYIVERLIERIETKSADTFTSWGMTHRSEKIQCQQIFAV
ncbi:MAG: NB-ARC domain-containing protein [Cyanobacteriota bacterium]|nr:NB-ARC domain-containing protein [Cyanobacteriota bacterium]